MTLVRDINTKDWSISSTEIGEVVTSFNDLKQCVFNILMTVKGSDPLRPDFGCDIFSFVDKPINKILPLMVKTITTAIKLYEPRVTVTKIAVNISDQSNIKFDIMMNAVIGNFGLRVNYGKDPFGVYQGNYIVTEVGDFWVTENSDKVIYV